MTDNETACDVRSATGGPRLRWCPWLLLLGAVLIALGVGCHGASLTMDNHREYFESHREILNTLDAAIERSTLRVLSAPARSSVEINDHAMPPISGTAATQSWIDSVLRLDGISQATFDSLRNLLDKAQVRYVVRDSAFTTYVVGGSLDNLNGFLHLRPGAELPPIGSEIDRARLVVVSHLADDWYYFGTS